MVPTENQFWFMFGNDDPNIGGLVQERRNSIADALELRLSCFNPSKYRQTSNW